MRYFSLSVVFSLFALHLYAGEPLAVPNYDPFKQTEKILNKHNVVTTPLKQKKAYILYAIYDEKVNIDGRFYKIGDKVGRCNLWKIMQEKVLLQCHNKLKTVEFLTKRTYKRVDTKE